MAHRSTPHSDSRYRSFLGVLCHSRRQSLYCHLVGKRGVSQEDGRSREGIAQTGREAEQE